ncbi:hypothetical protein K8R30_00085 [archaeon]|nr:hypothetical protein [archaeon]
MVNVKLDFKFLQENEKNGLYATIVKAGEGCSLRNGTLGNDVENYDLGRAVISIHVTRSRHHWNDVLLGRGFVFGSEHTDVHNAVQQFGLEKYVVGGSK